MMKQSTVGGPKNQEEYSMISVMTNKEAQCTIKQLLGFKCSVT